MQKLVSGSHQPFGHLIAREILIGVEKKGFDGLLKDKE